MNMLQTDDFVRNVIISKSSVPSIILYFDRQMRELESICFDRSDGSAHGFECVGDVASWMRSNRLQLNVAKTEVLWISSVRRQHQIPAVPILVDLGRGAASSHCPQPHLHRL